jgi:hypothetical protein
MCLHSIEITYLPTILFKIDIKKSNGGKKEEKHTYQFLSNSEYILMIIDRINLYFITFKVH